ncbi:MAG: peptide chain release factor N(5)-glutamine methyltransferase [Candidatus Pacebacteria bacterium]|nr:peptide chain release factor N(5)-glutamine methyltransferase [Candidatus Paceibacterota bacterium]
MAITEPRLRAAGCDSPRLDAQILLAEVLKIDRARLLLDPSRELTDEQSDQYASLVAERIARKPLAKIIGRKEFWSLDFAVSTAVLDPRPDSETLVEAAIQIADRTPVDHPLTLCDLGTGSGCLIIALLKELTTARGIGLDSSAAALEIARFNGQNLASQIPNLDQRLEWRQADWREASLPIADIYIANPPYIALESKADLAPELDYEPANALFADDQGLAEYRAIIEALVKASQPSQFWLLFELGEGQEGAVRTLLTGAGFTMVYNRNDLRGRVRMIGGHYFRETQ